MHVVSNNRKISIFLTYKNDRHWDRFRFFTCICKQVYMGLYVPTLNLYIVLFCAVLHYKPTEDNLLKILRLS